MDFGIEEQKLVIEVISTLVHIKSTLIDMILKPAGVPADIYVPLFNQRDPLTGMPLSKRKVAPLIIEQLQVRPDGQKILFSIIRIATEWTKFNLSYNEYEARATVQKAKEVLQRLETIQEKEHLEAELTLQVEFKKRDAEKRTAQERDVFVKRKMYRFNIEK